MGQRHYKTDLSLRPYPFRLQAAEDKVFRKPDLPAGGFAQGTGNGQ